VIDWDFLALWRSNGEIVADMVNFCPEGSPYLTRREAVSSFPDVNNRTFWNPLPDASEAVYGRLLDEGVSQGMTMFEIDFMEKNFEMTPYYRSVAGAADGWLRGMSRCAWPVSPQSQPIHHFTVTTITWFGQELNGGNPDAPGLPSSAACRRSCARIRRETCWPAPPCQR
jgi:hypothetical protein